MTEDQEDDDLGEDADERNQLEDEYRDWQGRCRACGDFACCEHAPCIACFNCLGLSYADFL